MKRLIALLCLLAAPAFAQVQPLDDPNHLLDDAARTKVLTALMANYDATKVHIVVWLPTLAKDDVLLDKAVQYFKAKGIGQKDQDNGVLVLIDWANHRSRIEVGYGLEGVMTDASTKALQDSAMNPHFKKGDLAGGLLAGIAVLSNYSQQWLKEKTEGPKHSGVEAWIAGIVALILIAAFAGIFAIGRHRRLERDKAVAERARERDAQRQREQSEMRSAIRTSPSLVGADLGMSGAAAMYRNTPRSTPAPSRAKDTRSKGGGYIPAATSSNSCSSRSSCSSSSSSSDSSSSSSSYDSGGGSSGGGGSDSSW